MLTRRMLILLSIQKAAVFLMLIGPEKGQNVIELMDNGEIKAIIPEIQRLTVIAPNVQAEVWNEFKTLGYKDDMTPSEALTIIRFLFNGSTICEWKRKSRL